MKVKTHKLIYRQKNQTKSQKELNPVSLKITVKRNHLLSDTESGWLKITL